MNERAQRPESGAGDDENLVAELLREAGARADLPESDVAAVAAVARDAWRFQVRRRKRRRLAVAAAIAAIAASVLVAVAVTMYAGATTAPTALGEIAALRGSLARLAATGARSPASVGEAIQAGTELETGATDSSAALALAAGEVSLRLDRGTRVRLVSDDEIDLLRGAVYVDTGDHSGRESGDIRVRTPLGTATDVGTQFSVRLLEEGPRALRVSVRTGAVSLAHQGGELVTAAAEELVVDAEGSVLRRALAPDDDAWTWAVTAAPRFDVEGRTLGEVLRWACRESGWRLRYETPELEREVETILVRGGLGPLGANRAPFAVLPGAGLDGAVDGGVLTVVRAR